MGSLVLFGTGLLGVVLSVGVRFAGASEGTKARYSETVARIANVAIPLALVVVYLHCTFDLVELSVKTLGMMGRNLEGTAWIVSRTFDW